MVDLTSANKSTWTFHEFWGWIHSATNIDKVMKVFILLSGINCFPVTLKKCTHTLQLQSNTTIYFHFAEPSSVLIPIFYNLNFYYQTPSSSSNISTCNKFYLVWGSLPNSLCSGCTLEVKRGYWVLSRDAPDIKRLDNATHALAISFKKWWACSVQLSSYGCTREVAKHERSVRVARGDSRVRL